MRHTILWHDRAMYTRRLSAELAHLVPYIDRNLQKSSTRVASVVIATAHNRAAHIKDCTVQSHRLPLTALVSDKGVVQSGHACIACVRKRANHIASELFCRHMESQCAKEAQTDCTVPTTNRGPALQTSCRVPDQLMADILESYASLEAFMNDVVLFACSAQTPGRTWLVYCPPKSRKLPVFGKGIPHRVIPTELDMDEDDINAAESALPSARHPGDQKANSHNNSHNKKSHDHKANRGDVGGGRLYVLNLGANEVPLVHGLWPLAVINMTEAVLCAAIAKHSLISPGDGLGGLGVAATHPPWSRAARLARRSACTPSSAGAQHVQQECDGQSAPSSGTGGSARLQEHASAMHSLDRSSGNIVRMAALGIMPTLESIREHVVIEALSTMNWSFVDEQLTLAKAYYNSEERQATQAARRAVQESEAVSQALRALHSDADAAPAQNTGRIMSNKSRGDGASSQSNPHVNSDTTSKGGENGGGATAQLLPDESRAHTTTVATEMEGAMDAVTAVSTIMPRAQRAGNRARQPLTGVLPEANATTTIADSAEAERADVTRISQVNDDVYSATTVPTSAKQDTQSSDDSSPSSPKTAQRKDGTWEYTYSDGSVTLVMPNGTKLFHKADGTCTTVYSDGSTLFEYTNNTSILDRADGIRITTFSDGTTKEELFTQ